MAFCQWFAASRIGCCDQRVEDLTLVVDGTLEAHPLAGDPDHHLLQMPSVSRPRTTLRSRRAITGPNFSTQLRIVS
jgi:hypothetical protein